MKLTEKELQYFNDCLKEFLTSDQVLKMQDYTQHGNTSCLQHCLFVAYYSYLVSRRFHLTKDYRSLIRGALLHDFFLYDWHEKSDRKGLHGFTHPKVALENAQKHFVLNTIEKDIILKHMWPLTLRLPRYKEAYLVSFIDKYCSLAETFKAPLPLPENIIFT